MYVVAVCVGLLCMDYTPTRYQFDSLTACLEKGTQLRFSGEYSWYVNNICVYRETRKVKR